MAIDKRFLLYAVGIFSFYFYFGILQEKITRGKYGEGEKQEKFTYTLALVCIQCLVNFIYAKTMLMTVMKQGEDHTSTTYYATSSLTYLLAMVCSNSALQWISYPTQVPRLDVNQSYLFYQALLSFAYLDFTRLMAFLWGAGGG